MKAEVLGVHKTDFMGRDGPVKITKFHLAVDSGDIDLGREANFLSWNELTDYMPPLLKVGQIIGVRYNRQGKLVFEDDSQSTSKG